MSFFKKSACLIGALLLLMVLQGAQSLWQVRQLGESSVEIAASASLATRSRILWDDFLKIDEEVDRVLAFTDLSTIDQARSA